MPEPTRWHHPHGSLARDGWDVVVDDSLPGWRWTGLRVAELAGDTELALESGNVERIVVPLDGRAEVDWADDNGTGSISLAGRPSVFSGPTDVAYLGTEVRARIRGDGRIAVAEAPTTVQHPVQHLAAAAVPVSLRGAGRATRQVHDLGMPGGLEAARLLVCEVITPAGNWSSFPPHKHDRDVPGRETELEEIYYFESRTERTLTEPNVTTPVGAAPFAFFTTYSSGRGPRSVADLRVPLADSYPLRRRRAERQCSAGQAASGPHDRPPAPVERREL